MSEPDEVVFGDLTIGKLLPADTVLPAHNMSEPRLTEFDDDGRPIPVCAHQWLLLPAEDRYTQEFMIREGMTLRPFAWCPECGETREAP